MKSTISSTNRLSKHLCFGTRYNCSTIAQSISLITITSLIFYAFSIRSLFSLRRGSIDDVLFHSTLETYPKYIPVYPIRRDTFTGKEVSRGVLEKLGGVSDFVENKEGKWSQDGVNGRKKVPFSVFERTLQCAASEPDIDGPRGALALAKMIPVSRRTLEALAAWIETEGACMPWASCNAEVAAMKEKKFLTNDTMDSRTKMIRIRQGRMYYDWPWGMNRAQLQEKPDYFVIRLFGAVLEILTDVPDSVFFIRSYDYPLFPANVPCPAFSHTPTIKHSDIPNPWPRPVAYEIMYHINTVLNGEEVFFESNPALDSVWNSKKPKAAFFGVLWRSPASTSRQVVLALAKKHPHLIDAKWIKAFGPAAFNPTSTETGLDEEHDLINSQFVHEEENSEAVEGRRTPGNLRHIADMNMTERIPLSTYMSSYKYLIVLAGNNGVDRLSLFLGHSGAVILLQETDVLTTFSSRLKPWVHYVPITFSAADVIEKIQWLQSHDDMARQIALNAHNFAQSYLRLEDFYCYTARALYSIASVEEASALEPFNALPVHDIDIESNEKLKSKHSQSQSHSQYKKREPLQFQV